MPASVAQEGTIHTLPLVLEGQIQTYQDHQRHGFRNINGVMRPDIASYGRMPTTVIPCYASCVLKICVRIKICSGVNDKVVRVVFFKLPIVLAVHCKRDWNVVQKV